MAIGSTKHPRRIQGFLLLASLFRSRSCCLFCVPPVGPRVLLGFVCTRKNTHICFIFVGQLQCFCFFLLLFPFFSFFFLRLVDSRVFYRPPSIRGSCAGFVQLAGGIRSGSADTAGAEQGTAGGQGRADGPTGRRARCSSAWVRVNWVVPVMRWVVKNALLSTEGVERTPIFAPSQLVVLFLRGSKPGFIHALLSTSKKIGLYQNASSRHGTRQRVHLKGTWSRIRVHCNVDMVWLVLTVRELLSPSSTSKWLDMNSHTKGSQSELHAHIRLSLTPKTGLHIWGLINKLRSAPQNHPTTSFVYTEPFSEMYWRFFLEPFEFKIIETPVLHRGLSCMANSSHVSVIVRRPRS